MNEHPTDIHARSFAMIRSMLRGDTRDVATMAAETLNNLEAAAAQIVSLIQVSALMMRLVPEAELDGIFTDIAVSLAEQEPPR